MSGRMKYEKGGVEVGANPTRMETLPDLTVAQFMSLPVGGELLIIDIKTFGFGLTFKAMIVTEESREKDAASLRQQGVPDDAPIPGSIFIYLQPENYDPTVEQILGEQFIRRGYRDGREGAPQASMSSLKERHPNDWSDEAYTMYLAAYKRGSESRKGR